MSISERSLITCRFFSGIVVTLTRTQGEKFDYMFLVKIASKGTSLTPDQRDSIEIKSLFVLRETR